MYNEFISRINHYKKNICPTITFQVTEDCNLRCSYCYQQNKTNHIMSLETAKKFIDLVFSNKNKYLSYKKWKGIILEFIGGEPFLQIELIDNILEYFLQKMVLINSPLQYFFRISLTTNGTLYFNPKVQEFIKKWNYFLSLTITVDGNKEFHDSCRKFPNGKGSYDLAIAAAQDYKKLNGIFPETKITITPQNLKYLSDGIISLIKIGYTNLSANYVFEEGWSQEDAQLYYNELIKIANYIKDKQIDISFFNKDKFKPIVKENKDFYCGGNGRMIAVNWNGDIFPCLRFMETDYIIGNIKDNIIKKDKKLSNITTYNYSLQRCQECLIAFGCMNCLAYDYLKNNKFEKTIFCCDIYKAQWLANIYYYNLIQQPIKLDENAQRLLASITLAQPTT